MKLNKKFTNLKFKNKSELLSECKRLIYKSDVLNPIPTEIKNLKRGKVSPKSTLKRSKIGSYFSSEIQRIFNYIYNNKIIINEEVVIKLKKILSKADAILRENIVLQSNPPLDVIKFKNIPVRYGHNGSGGKEQRWGYGLHKFPLTEQGYSFVIALMPPQYIQNYHNHTISEHTLMLDLKTVGFYNPEKNKKKNIAHKNEIVYFSATTPHTLYNPTDSLSRNISLKLPVGLIDWKPIYDLNPIKKIHSEVLKGKSSRLSINRTKISFSIKDKDYDYELEILELKKGSIMECIYNKDKYFFVIDGEFLISSGNIKKSCSKNDYIVIDKNTNFKIKTKTKSRLYTVVIR